MAEEQKNYGFALRIQRKLDKKEKRMLRRSDAKVIGSSHAYLALVKPDGTTKEFHFAPAADRAVDFTFGRFLSYTAVALPIHGEAYSKAYNARKAERFADELYFPITATEYDALNVDLSSSNPRFYHLLLHNCTTWATKAAAKQGFEIPPSSLIVSPESIGRTLKQLSIEQKRDAALLDAMGECDFAAEYSPDQRDAPLKPEGHVRRLMERINRGNYYDRW